MGRQGRRRRRGAATAGPLGLYHVGKLLGAGGVTRGVSLAHRCNQVSLGSH
jgi:hypothetical protein